MKHVKLYEQFLNENVYKKIAGMFIGEIDWQGDNTELAKMLIKSQNLDKKKVISAVTKELGKYLKVNNRPVALSEMKYRKTKSYERWDKHFVEAHLIGELNYNFDITVFLKPKARKYKIRVRAYIGEHYDSYGDFYLDDDWSRVENYTDYSDHEWFDKQESISVPIAEIDSALKNIQKETFKEWNKFMKTEFHEKANEIIEEWLWL